MWQKRQGTDVSVPFLTLLTHLSLASSSFCGIGANSADTDQTPQNVASNQALNCLLTEYSIKNWIKKEWKNTNQQPFKRKWTGTIDKSGKFHSA